MYVCLYYRHVLCKYISISKPVNIYMLILYTVQSKSLRPLFPEWEEIHEKCIFKNIYKPFIYEPFSHILHQLIIQLFCIVFGCIL